jgi:dCTP deaminase
MADPAVYSDAAILLAMQDRDIVISPFDEKSLGTSSYDVRLGEWYYAERPPSGGQRTAVYDIYSEEQMRQVWGDPRHAEHPEDVLPPHTVARLGLRDTDRIILLEPGETVLAHTEEFIGGRDHITTMMKARSSFGRNFIEVCKCAGWGDVGFINRWTMEVTNNSRYYHIPLVVGRRIAQIIFFETGSILDRTKDYGITGKYQSGRDLEYIKAKWQPEMMLPRLHLDREVLDEARKK